MTFTAVNAAPPITVTPSHIVSRQAARWQGLQGEILQATDLQSFEYTYQAPCHLLIACERSERDEGETQVEGLPRSNMRHLTRKLTFVPANSRFHGWQRPRVLTRVNCFYIDPHGPLLDPELGFADTQFQPRLFFFDADLWETALKLKALIEEPHSAGRLYAEALGVVLCHQLLRLNGGGPAAPPPATGGLAVWQQKRVEQYIRAHVAERVSLSTLAALVGLSPYHFARAFKQSFAMPPHRFHMIRRVEEAKILLARRDMSVTEVGLRLGLSETSAFTTGFHKLTGMSPTQYRRSLE